MVVKMVKEELEGQEVKTESNGFLQVGKVQNGVKLKSRLKIGSGNIHCCIKSTSSTAGWKEETSS